MSKINRLLAASLLASFALLLSASAQTGQDGENSSRQSHKDYTAASFQGTYASVGIYGANIARLLGVGHPDGKGNTYGNSIVNLPGPNGTRSVVSISYQGTYTIDSDGFGIVNYIVTLPNGATTNVTLDFLATKAEYIGGRKIITEFATMQREPSSVVGGEFVMHNGTRRPD